MLDQFDKLIFIDLETTGPNPASDRITEIGIVEVSVAGIQRWSTLVNPQAPIPPYIRQLTGIDEDMVRDAPTFEQVEQEVLKRLEDGLFIAHNARFDYGFLRSAFKRAGSTLRCDVLCTVKLSRLLFPHEIKHSLDALVERHGLVSDARHRALADADILWQFWNMLASTIPSDTLNTAVLQLLQRPNLPMHLDPDLLDDLPDSRGVYMFRGEGDTLLHVGRAAQLRQRVLSHFHSDRPSQKDQLLARQVRRIEWQETASEIGAQLLEAHYAKQLKSSQETAQPGLCAWQLCPDEQGVLKAVLRHEREHDFGRSDRLYGPFTSPQKAEMALRALAEKHELCLARLGLEVARPGKPCTARVARHCRGACIGADSPEAHAARLEQALLALNMLTWPYPGPIALKETGTGSPQDLHVIDNWCWLGTAHDEREAAQVLAAAPASPAFEIETYRIVSRALSSGKASVHHLDRDVATARPAVL